MSTFEFNAKNIEVITRIAVEKSKRNIEFATKECAGDNALDNLMKAFMKEILADEIPDMPEIPVHYHIVFKFNDINVQEIVEAIGENIPDATDIIVAKEIIIHPEDYFGYSVNDFYIFLRSEIDSIYQKIASAKAGLN